MYNKEDAHIAKPMQTGNLKAAIRQVLDKKGSVSKIAEKSCLFIADGL